MSEAVSMKYIRNNYGVPAKRGMRVDAYYRRNGGWVLALSGKITSASNNLYINGLPFHPTHDLVYLDKNGSVLLDTRVVKLFPQKVMNRD